MPHVGRTHIAATSTNMKQLLAKPRSETYAQHSACNALKNEKAHRRAACSLWGAAFMWLGRAQCDTLATKWGVLNKDKVGYIDGSGGWVAVRARALSALTALHGTGAVVTRATC